MPDDIVHIACPLGHSFPARKIAGTGAIEQQFTCPTCFGRFVHKMECAVEPLSHVESDQREQPC